MNFNLTEDQQLFRSIVRDFVAREVTPVAAQIDEAGEFPRPLFARCAENGYFGLRYPEALGGADEVGDDGIPFEEKMAELPATRYEQFTEADQLEALANRGVLTKIGTTGKGTYYVLSRKGLIKGSKDS